MEGTQERGERRHGSHRLVTLNRGTQAESVLKIQVSDSHSRIKTKHNIMECSLDSTRNTQTELDVGEGSEDVGLALEVGGSDPDGNGPCTPT